MCCVLTNKFVQFAASDRLQRVAFSRGVSLTAQDFGERRATAALTLNLFEYPDLGFSTRAPGSIDISSAPVSSRPVNEAKIETSHEGVSPIDFSVSAVYAGAS